MSSGEEIMMPVPKPEAVSMAEIHAMRQLTDAVGTLTRQIERMNAKVDDVRERVIKLEARDYERKIDDLKARLEGAAQDHVRQIEGLQGRIDALESSRDKQSGAMGVGTWLTKNAPWLLAGIAAFAAGLGAKGGT